MKLLLGIKELLDKEEDLTFMGENDAGVNDVNDDND